MFDLGWAELLIVAAIALFVIGPQDIPKIAYQIGKAFRRLKYMQYALSGQFDDFMKTQEKKDDGKEELDHDPMDEAEADRELMEMLPLPDDKVEKDSSHRGAEAQRDISKTIREINFKKSDYKKYKKHLADCVVLSAENKILIQKRPDDWHSNAGGLNIFGGHVDEGETIHQALIRELKEELGAKVIKKDIIDIGTVTEEFTGHSEAVHVHFWHDKKNTITGCYEAELLEFDNFEQAVKQEKLMDYSIWALRKCEERGFIK